MINDNRVSLLDEESFLRIYLDVCCLNRPFDEQTQDRVRLETEAILTILSHCKNRCLEPSGTKTYVKL